MHLHRTLKSDVLKKLNRMPGVVLLGPRQVGKTTLARQIAEERNAVYLDLEQLSERAKLENFSAYVESQGEKLIVLDEVQTAPDLFMKLRGIIDERRFKGQKFGQFLLLGSASKELLQQSSESLAGRVSYVELSGLGTQELPPGDSVEKLWLRGGYPDSFLAELEEDSYRIRGDIHRTLFERDIPQIAGNYNNIVLRHYLSMIGHLHGDVINKDKIAKSLSVSSTTIKRYTDMFEDLMLFRMLQPWFRNSKKRLVRKPRVYMRDSGLLHFVHGIKDLNALLGHPALGKSWEGFVIERLCQHLPYGVHPYFYRSNENEVDLILESYGREVVAIEIKRSDMPHVRQGFHKACEDIEPTQKIVIYGGKDSYPKGDGLTAMSLIDAVAHVQKTFQP